MTTEEAARLLFVSRPYVVELLDANHIPTAQVTQGGERRVRKVDVLRYKHELKARQQNALSELVEKSETMGLYDLNPTTPRVSKR